MKHQNDANELIHVLFSSIIRLAAGRTSYTESEQAFAFMAGANAIFTGERMLTTPTNGWDEDNALLSRWGLSGWGSFESDHLRHEREQEEELNFGMAPDQAVKYVEAEAAKKAAEKEQSEKQKAQSA